VCSKPLLLRASLESEEDEESHHEAEEAHGLGQSETHDTVGEQLTLHAGVTSVRHHETAEHGSDTSSCKTRNININISQYTCVTTMVVIHKLQDILRVKNTIRNDQCLLTSVQRVVLKL
jgi:hypothetical protein